MRKLALVTITLLLLFAVAGCCRHHFAHGPHGDGHGPCGMHKPCGMETPCAMDKPCPMHEGKPCPCPCPKS